jgi:hypothetical protein
MKLAFEKVIEEYNLDLENLPSDIQKSITDIKKSKGAIETRIQLGHDVKDATIENLKEKDAELVERIFDHLEIDNDDDSDDESNESGNEEEEENMLDVSKYDGNKIDSELSALLDQGVTEINFMEIRSACPHTYELLFEAYEANKENGVRTSHFEMIETEPNSETFYISKL